MSGHEGILPALLLETQPPVDPLLPPDAIPARTIVPSTVPILPAAEEKGTDASLCAANVSAGLKAIISRAQRLINLEIPVLVRSLKSSNVELG